VSWDHISIVLYDETRRTWVVKKVMNRTPEGPVTVDQPVDFPESLTGKAIRSNTACLIDSLASSATPRYSTRERPVKKGCFAAVPVSSMTKCYGSLNIESVEAGSISPQDAETLRRLAESAAVALEVLYLQEVIAEYVIIDESTGLYSKKFFAQRLTEELRRADDCSCDLTLLLIAVDRAHDVGQRYGHFGFERMMTSVARAIRQNVRPYDLVGRYDGDQFAITLLDTGVNDASLWAEKIRKAIAANVIAFEEKSFSITVSLGLAGRVEGIRQEDVATNAETVLRRAAESGGNCIRVY
jgi:diguanylate cyclase (GGDEF)-like protein